MNKSILVIDTPEYCRECPLCAEDRQTYRDYCRITDDVIWSLDKPDWCPLKPLPEKETNDRLVEWGNGYKSGWNKCLDAILGE